MKWHNHRYFDKPDGEDLPGKLISCVKIGGVIGASMSMPEFFAKPRPPMVIALNVLRHVYHGVAIGAVFSTAVYITTRYRKQDTAENYIVGALATSPLVMSWMRLNFRAAAELMPVLAIFMVGVKASRTQPSGVEKPYKYLLMGEPVRYTHFDYYDYWTGRIKPLDDYCN